MFKISLWVITIVGLAPACILAAYVLYVNVGNYFSERNAAQSETSGAFALTAVSFDDVPVSGKIWPAALALAGAGIFAAGLLFMFEKQPEPRAGNINDVPIIIASLSEQERKTGPDFVGVSVGDEGPYFILHGGDNVMVSFPYQDLDAEQFTQIREIACNRHGEVVEHEVYPEGGGVQIYTFDQVPYATDFCLDVLTEGFHVKENTKILFTMN